MMKSSKVCVALFVMILSFIIRPVYGESTENTHVSVTDSGASSGSLRINRISYVGFGEKVLRKSADNYYAATDLVLELEDSRAAASPWQLNLKLSPFINEKKEKLQGISYHLGIGKVSAEKATIIGQEYSSDSNTEGEEFSKVLVSEGTEKGIFTYTIKASDIWLYLPPNQPQGTFHSEKTWLLVDSI
ncbi:WxL domain-containing protein [Candidatus Enterococcus clewellii]|uniref:WxL domain-containing protein n=1 Tax=Candidatus Enterococcus clewellii TaxID=1834193 RepID=A0A242K851_9ENTE|nr:WxL domain-containing protein [Enterococcus sp. 9E7_DIV0242]OTP17136.1 hypothetical protein A5888_001274 [Enterococcus sp. 9E7_DIV0242]